ncbi:MAG: hypothetical protein ACLUN5_17655 [Oscillospiraceae bacterium]
MMTFLSSSLAAGALILLTALVRRFAGSRLPRRMYIALWDIAVLRLLIPSACRAQTELLLPMCKHLRLFSPCRQRR